MKGFFEHWLDRVVAQMPYAADHPGMIASAQCVARLADDTDAPLALREDAIDSLKFAIDIMVKQS